MRPFNVSSGRAVAFPSSDCKPRWRHQSSLGGPPKTLVLAAPIIPGRSPQDTGAGVSPLAFWSKDPCFRCLRHDCGKRVLHLRRSVALVWARVLMPPVSPVAAPTQIAHQPDKHKDGRWIAPIDQALTNLISIKS